MIHPHHLIEQSYPFGTLRLKPSNEGQTVALYLQTPDGCHRVHRPFTLTPAGMTLQLEQPFTSWLSLVGANEPIPGVLSERLSLFYQGQVVAFLGMLNPDNPFLEPDVFDCVIIQAKKASNCLVLRSATIIKGQPFFVCVARTETMGQLFEPEFLWRSLRYLADRARDLGVNLSTVGPLASASFHALMQVSFATFVLDVAKFQVGSSFNLMEFFMGPSPEAQRYLLDIGTISGLLHPAQTMFWSLLGQGYPLEPAAEQALCHFFKINPSGI